MALFSTKVRLRPVDVIAFVFRALRAAGKALKLWRNNCSPYGYMKTFIPSICSVALLGGLLLAPLATLPTTLRADDHKTYHDKGHNDDHEWNSHEDQAYRMWVKENHRKYRDFAKLPDGDRESYWAWRHEHSDAVLKIDIR